MRPISGVNTEVIFKTCKDGYLFEINALTGDLIWAWSPPVADGFPRCPICYPMDPTNKTQTSIDFPTALTSGASLTGPQPSFLQYPSELAGFEDQQAFNPATNTIFAAAQIVPYYMTYLGLNSSTYFTSTGETGTPAAQTAAADNNATIFAINACDRSRQLEVLRPTARIQGRSDHQRQPSLRDAVIGRHPDDQRSERLTGERLLHRRANGRTRDDRSDGARPRDANCPSRDM